MSSRIVSRHDVSAAARCDDAVDEPVRRCDVVVVRASSAREQTLALDAELGAALFGVARERARLGDADELVGDVDALLYSRGVERARVASEHVDGGIGVGELGAAVARDARIAVQPIEIVLQAHDFRRRARRHAWRRRPKQRRAGERPEARCESSWRTSDLVAQRIDAAFDFRGRRFGAMLARTRRGEIAGDLGALGNRSRRRSTRAPSAAFCAALKHRVRFIEIGRRVTRGVVALGRLHRCRGLREFELRGVAIDGRGGAGYRQRRETEESGIASWADLLECAHRPLFAADVPLSRTEYAKRAVNRDETRRALVNGAKCAEWTRNAAALRAARARRRSSPS